MIDAIAQVNPLAICAASIANFVLGGVWFAGIVAKPYAIALGIEHRAQQRPGPLFVAGPLLCGAIIVTTTAVLMRALGSETYGDALALGALVSLGYLVPMTVTIAINPLFPRPLVYALVNAPFFVVSGLLSSLVLMALT